VTSGGGGDGISPRARAAADRARRRARDEVPTPEALASMTVNAATGADMSPAEIRRLAASVIAQSQQVAFLLGKLAAIAPEHPEQENPR
jgi:hypothetical protein